MGQEKLETIANVSSKVTYGGASSAFFFGLTVNEIAALGGLVIALIGLLVNIHYKQKALMALTQRIGTNRTGDIPKALQEFNEQSD